MYVTPNKHENAIWHLCVDDNVDDYNELRRW